MIDVFTDPLFQGFVVQLGMETLPKRAMINELTEIRFRRLGPLMDKIKNSSTPQLLNQLEDSVKAIAENPVQSTANDVLDLLHNVKTVLSKVKVLSVTDEAKIQADSDSIMEYALTQFYPVVQEAIAFPCVHRTQGNCPPCFDMKVKNYSRWMAEKGWELTKLHGHRQLSESTKKLIG